MSYEDEIIDYKELSEKQAKQIEDLHIRVAAMSKVSPFSVIVDDISHFVSSANPMQLVAVTYVVCTIATTVVTIAMDIKRGMRW